VLLSSYKNPALRFFVPAKSDSESIAAHYADVMNLYKNDHTFTYR